MADKNTGMSRERIGQASDEQLTGRESSTMTPRTEYGVPGAGAGSGTTARPTAPAGREPGPEVRTRKIRAEIEQTRDDMSETVNAIQERLRPGNIAANAAESVREAAQERVRDIAESDSAYYVRANPVPTAMVGIGLAGLAWLAFGGNDADRYRRSQYRNSARDWRRPAGRYQDDRYPGGPAYGNTGALGYDDDSTPGYSARSGSSGYGSETEVSRVAERAGEWAEDTSRRVRQTTHRAQSQLQRTWNESPLLLGAAAAVLGALIGSAVPETERENELMGETRDNMVEGVEQAVKDKVDQVQNAATEAVSSVQQAVGLAPSDDSASSGNGTATRSTPRPKTGTPRQTS